MWHTIISRPQQRGKLQMDTVVGQCQHAVMNNSVVDEQEECWMRRRTA